MATENPVPGKKLSEKEAAEQAQSALELRVFNTVYAALDELDDEETQQRVINSVEVLLGLTS